MDATVPGVEINLALQRTYRLLEGLPTDERIASRSASSRDLD